MNTRMNEIIAERVAEATFGSGLDYAEIADDVEKALCDATGGPDHIVTAKGSAWTMRHPLTERFEGAPGKSLMACQFTPLVQVAAEQGAFTGTGQHRVWLDRGVLLWEQIS